jgi:hypothetical protein
LIGRRRKARRLLHAPQQPVCRLCQQDRRAPLLSAATHPSRSRERGSLVASLFCLAAAPGVASSAATRLAARSVRPLGAPRRSQDRSSKQRGLRARLRHHHRGRPFPNLRGLHRGHGGRPLPTCWRKAICAARAPSAASRMSPRAARRSDARPTGVEPGDHRRCLWDP